MDVSISVFVLMFLRDFIYVNNCKIYFKNFNVLRVFLYYNVKKGRGGGRGRGEEFVRWELGSNKMLEFYWKFNIVLLRNEFE